MKSFITSTLLFASLSWASPIHPDIAVLDVDLDPVEDKLLHDGRIAPEEIIQHKTPKDVIYLPQPTAKTVKDADKLPGKWTDE